MTAEESFILNVRKVVAAKHNDASQPGFQHVWDSDCPACNMKALINAALVTYDEQTNYRSFQPKL